LIADLYPNRRIPSEIQFLALQRLNGGPNIATLKGYTREQKRMGLLLALESDAHLVVWQGEALIVWGLNKDRDVSELEIMVPLNIQTRKKGTQIRRSSKR
jgi:hypothetical protein